MSNLNITGTLNAGDLKLNNESIQEAVNFAESERQKSKNLFPQASVVGTGNTRIYPNIPIASGEYTMSALVSSSDIDASTSLIIFGNEDESYSKYVYLSRDQRSSTSVVLEKDCTYVTFYASTNYGNSSGDTFTYENIQLEEGTEATDYVPYYGEIVHENDITPEVIYDIDTQNIIGGVAYSDGLTNVQVSKIDFTRYKGLYIYYIVQDGKYTSSGTIYLDLNGLAVDAYYYAGTTFQNLYGWIIENSSLLNEYYCLQVKVTSDKTAFECINKKATLGGSITTPTAFYIRRIEGVR